jgi:exodeoxyribonuclease-3
MRFLTWNIQGGGGSRIPSIVHEISRLQPDVVGLTEVRFGNLEELRRSLAQQGYDYIETTCSSGSTNSVLLASKSAMTVIDEPIAHDQERWLSVEVGGGHLKILCIHIPGGTDNKFGADGVGMSGKKRKELLWDEVIRYARQHRNEKVVILGDFNTGLPEDAEGTPFVLSDYMRVLRLEKYVDAWRHLNPRVREYTWYTKRKNKETSESEDYNGFRLDYVFVSPALRESIVDARHEHGVRINRVSDHAIVFADLSIDPKTSRGDIRPNDDGRADLPTTPTHHLRPPPMDTAHEPSDSLISALTKARIPPSNHAFIRQFTTAIGIVEFQALVRPDKPFVRATRRDGLPDLHIHYGYTNGFTSEEEIIRSAGTGAERAPSSRKGTWYVAHPTNQVRPGGERLKNIQREANYCGCGMQLSLTGVCANCD